jgi:hypothetical protein
MEAVCSYYEYKVSFGLYAPHRIEFGEVQDPCYEGIDFVISCLQRIKDVDVIYNHAGWIVQKYPKGVQIFTRRPNDEAMIFRPDEVHAALSIVVAS